MKIADFLAPADVKIDVASTNKNKLLAELACEAAAKIARLKKPIPASNSSARRRVSHAN